MRRLRRSSPPRSAFELGVSDFDVACSLVRADRDTGRRDPAVEQLQRAGDDAVTEEPFAGTDHHGEYPEPVLVDQSVPEQRLDQARAAVDLDLGAILTLQLRHILGHAADKDGVAPLHLLQGSRGDVLAGAVELVRDRPSSYGQCAAKIS